MHSFTMQLAQFQKTKYWAHGVIEVKICKHNFKLVKNYQDILKETRLLCKNSLQMQSQSILIPSNSHKHLCMFMHVTFHTCNRVLWKITENRVLWKITESSEILPPTLINHRVNLSNSAQPVCFRVSIWTSITHSLMQ